MKKLLILFAAFMCAFNGRTQTILTLRPGNTAISAHIDDKNPDTPNATYPYINAGYNTVSGTPTHSHNFMKFNLSGIPVGSTILSAKLSLYHATGANHSNSTNNYEMFSKVLGSWNPDSLTWNTQPAYSGTDTIQIGNTLTTTDNKTDIDILSFIQYWVNNPAQNFGMAMMLVDESQLYNFQVYGSGFNADSSTWPQLVITYQGCNNETVLQPGAEGNDSHIDNLNHASNFSTYPFVNAGYNTVSGTPTLSHEYMQYNLSAIPSGAVVTSAKLSLYHAAGSNSSNSSNNYEMFAQVTGAWNHDSITWDNQPTYSLTDTIQIGNTATPTDSKTDIDITRFVQQWVSNPAQNFGMVMMLVDESSLYNFQSYGSCNNSDSTVRPKLVIEWSSCVAGIQEPANSSMAFDIYPNPVSNVFRIRTANDQPVDAEIYDISGRCVLSSKQVTQLDASNLQAGVYLVHISNKYGSATRKLIKD